MGKGTVTITGNYKGEQISLNIPRITEVKVSRELDGGDTVPIINGEPVSVPASDKGYTIDIDVLYADSLENYIKLAKALKGLEAETGSLSVFENTKTRDGNISDEKHFQGVLITSNEYTLNAEDLTASSLSFTATSLKSYINGVEI